MKLKLITVIAVMTLILGCETAGIKEDDKAAQLGGLDGDGPLSGRELSDRDRTVSYDRVAINDPASVLAERVIYFDFDSERITPDFMDLINHHGRYLAANGNVSMRLEGHADERGTREYNVALGNRRAEAVKRILMLQGSQSNQVSVISYGEEKPVALDHDEEAWRLNRRVELVYKVE